VPASNDLALIKIKASFSKGVLTISLPKKPEAIKPEKHIDIKVR
jgi:HSP20 family protein